VVGTETSPRPAAQELEYDDLGEGVLEGDSVGSEIRITPPASHLLTLRIAQVVDEHLLGECERAPEAPAPHGRSLGPPGIDRLDQRPLGRRGLDRAGNRSLVAVAVLIIWSDRHQRLPALSMSRE
jgi:hypothetical protein